MNRKMDSFRFKDSQVKNASTNEETQTQLNASTNNSLKSLKNDGKRGLVTPGQNVESEIDKMFADIVNY